MYLSLIYSHNVTQAMQALGICIPAIESLSYTPITMWFNQFSNTWQNFLRLLLCMLFFFFFPVVVCIAAAVSDCSAPLYIPGPREIVEE